MFIKKIYILIFSVLMMPFLSSAELLHYNEKMCFEALVQHYCYFSYNLFIRSCKDKESRAFLSPKNAKVIQFAQQKFDQDIDTIKKQFYSNQELSDGAINAFGNHILGLCKKFSIKKLFVLSLPEKLDSQLTYVQKLDQIDQALKILEKFYDKIKSMPPLLKRVENALFYNFISTKVVPKLIIAAGGIGSLIWGAKIVEKYSHGVRANTVRNIFYKYNPIDHDQHSEPDQSANNPNNPLGFAAAAFMQPKSSVPYIPCQHAYRDNHVCNGADGSCYENIGFNSNPALWLYSIAKGSRFISAFVGSWFFSRWIEDAQMPRYLYRISQKQKIEEQKKIEEEMRTMKINQENEIGFDGIKGHKALIDREFRMIVDFLIHPFKYKSKSGTLSVLLYGPPGTGKTLLARSIAKESGAPFLEITADDILSESSKEKILATWKMAEDAAAKREKKSAIIYIDEIDCVVGNREKGTIDPLRAKALSNLLAIFDGIEKRNPYLHIVVLITTNHHKDLDPALMRPGRIDKKIYIGNPNADGRKEFFEEFLPEQNKHLISRFVQRTDGLNGAEIVNLIESAQMLASYNNRAIPTEQDYEEAFKNFSLQKTDTHP